MEDIKTTLIECWWYKDRHYNVKLIRSIDWFWDKVYRLTCINVILNKKIELSKIDDEFTREEIKNVIINYSLFLLKIKNGSYL